MTTELIEENVVPGKRLGRHVHHDPRSLQYLYRASPSAALVSKRWSKPTDTVLDQGDLGSCTGNATVGSLLCSNDNPLHSALPVNLVNSLNEALAIRIYEQATKTDPFAGSYPPDDTGSDGLDAAKAAKSLGYINGYTHATSLADVLSALQHAPVIIGVDWTEGFDNPDANGLVKYSGSVRGGHEFCLDEIDVERGLVWFRNSWSTSWGIDGRACMTWDTLNTLLGHQGDVTVLTPLSAPAPQPAPPTPAPVDVDQALADEVHSTGWTDHKKLNKTNESLREALITWIKAKGL